MRLKDGRTDTFFIASPCLAFHAARKQTNQGRIHDGGDRRPQDQWRTEGG